MSILSDFFAIEQANQEAAAEKIPVWAGNIKAGDFFVRNYNYGGDSFKIYSEVLPMEEEDEDENTIVVSYEGNAYRFTKSYSYMCPQGELGDVHLSEVERLITPQEFAEAKSKGFR